jgi:hypothetical protein
MPPQDTGTKEPSETAAAATPAVGESYWEAPPEKKLEGKTLSTMELSMLQQDEHTQERKGDDDIENSKAAAAAAPAATPKRNSYWEWQENIQKSLSKLSLTDLFYQQSKKEGSSEKVVEGESANEKTKGEEEESTAADSSEEEKPRPYWFWRNASLKNLSSASLTSLENAAKASDAKQGADATPGSPPQENNSSFWFWRNPSLTNMSNVSLDTMEKTARETDRMEGKETSQEGPITNLQHKLRSSWRKSFQQLSSNSLSQLDESGADNKSTPAKWNRFSFARKSSVGEESFREEGEGGSDDGAIEF